MMSNYFRQYMAGYNFAFIQSFFYCQSGVPKRCLTHICQMYFPILINWTSQFPILVFVGGIFHFNSNFKRNFCNQTVENLIRHCASDLVLHCLLISHKIDAWLIWVNYILLIYVTFNLHTRS